MEEDLIGEFCDELMKFIRKVDIEYSSSMIKHCHLLLSDIYFSKREAAVMRDVLLYLKETFPDKIDRLEPLGVICQKAKSIEVI